jgi:hypothetical protein
MLEKCSNPDCDWPFDFREGRLIRFGPTDTKSPGQDRVVEHFWLCRECSERFVFAHERDAGMKTRLRSVAVLQEVPQTCSKQRACHGSTATPREKRPRSNVEQVDPVNSRAVKDGRLEIISARDRCRVFEAPIGKVDF